MRRRTRRLREFNAYRTSLREGRGPAVYFAPEFPRDGAVIIKVLGRLGVPKTLTPLGAGISFKWARPAVSPAGVQLRWLARRTPVVNLSCANVSKSRVEAVASGVLGYTLAVDPAQHDGPMVRKSDENAVHDGVILNGPVSPEPGYVYQQVIGNRVDDGLVLDRRVPVVGTLLPFAYRKLRPLDSRFSNRNVHAEMTDIEAEFSAEERGLLLAIARGLGLDYGEMDVLRDGATGRIYVVDVNPTPFGPPNHIRDDHYQPAIDALAEAFEATYGPALARSPAG
jgi:hypothetical protein